MSLRLKLLLVALSTLALPWAGWQYVRQTEALLRQGQEQALLASAGMLAKALQASRVPWPPAGPALYVQRAPEPIVVDGYADDWSALRPFAQALGPSGDAQKLRVLLARRDGDLYLLAEVRDATRARADARDPRVVVSDYVDLVLVRDDATRRYRLASSAPGRFTSAIVPESGESRSGQTWPPAATETDSALPDVLAGAWQEDGSGYRIELKFPRGLAVQRIGLVAHDSAIGGTDVPEPRLLLGYDEATARALEPLVPEHARARLVAADGWLLAGAGRLDAPAASRSEDVGRFAGWIYRWMIAPALTGSPELGGDPPRLDAAEVWQALSGVPATSWRNADYGVVVLAAAVPLGGADGPRGALVLEQASRALPLLANRALVGLAAATLAALAIAGTILLVFGATLSFRIRRLRNAAEQAVRTSGRLDGPMPLADSPDELGDLARSFRKLLDEVGAYTDYLRTLASKLSHELNTPLAIVKSSLDNLEHQGLPDAARSYLSRARDGADRLGAIVRAMSEANRIERAIAGAEAEDFDLRALVAGYAESYRALAAPRELRLDLPSSAVPYHGAPELIAQALDKLFDNACSFTPPGGWIALSLASGENATPVIRVANSGPPLPATMQDRLFDSLVSVRERAARAGETPHLGLGLYVVRLVAELHRGVASAGNLAEGGGVEFRLAMPGMPRRRLAEGRNDA
ncbi:ATP-binding protein [Dokdonella sp.]|uniref:ATP-binding protein n=1 Tax=Dokdonella sp. TaxID=2291710 RepID=UPI0026390B4C|nr:ATP-binding protein [Dokdonella sp.]